MKWIKFIYRLTLNRLFTFNICAICGEDSDIKNNNTELRVQWWMCNSCLRWRLHTIKHFVPTMQFLKKFLK